MIWFLALATSLAAQPLDVSSGRMLIIGDSHTAQYFGQRLDFDLRQGLPLWKVAIHGVCATSPHWFFEGLPTNCGVYEREPGQAPVLSTGAAKTPLLRDLHKPQDGVIVVALGTNLIVASTSTKTVSWWGMDTVTKMADTITEDYGIRCIWIGPPYVRAAKWRDYKGAADVSARLSAAIRQAARGCDYIDSVSVTRGLKDARFADGIHYKPAAAEAWADEIADRLEQLVR